MDSKEFAYRLKKTIIQMAEYCKNGEGYWGSYMSLVDILAVLFSETMSLDGFGGSDFSSDKLILSKGHSGLALYCAMHISGILDEEILRQYGKSGSGITQLASYNSEIGLELSGGSLGLGLPYATGIAMLAKKNNIPYTVYVIVGDGEIQEGANWEALLCAYKYNLNNLVVIVDYNKYQSDGACKEIMPIDLLEKKFESFGWTSVSIDGHNHDELKRAFSLKTNNPIAVIAHTVKGHGISFMENDNSWHHTQLKGDALAKARKEVERI